MSLLKDLLDKVLDLFRKEGRPIFWDSIDDMPAFYWIKIHEDNNLIYLLKSGSPYVWEVKKAWHKINNEYLNSYGLNSKTRLVISLRDRLAINLADYLITGDRVYEMEADILRKEIEAESSSSKEEKGVNYTKITTSIEKHFGFQIDTMKTSTRKYLEYVESLKENYLREVKQG